MGYTTKKSLLDAIQKGDDISWYDFYETYRPLILLRGHDFHLSASELEELCQMVMIDIFKQGNKFSYDPSKGKFRNYLRKVISHNAIDLLRKRSNFQPLDETENFIQEPPTQNWEDEWYNHLLLQALSILRSKIELSTYQAFELYALKQVPAAEVAKFLNIKIDMVYVAKSRAMQKLKIIIKNLKEEL